MKTHELFGKKNCICQNLKISSLAGIKRLFFGILICPVLLLAACSSKNDDFIRIGFIGPLSGEAAVFGIDCLNGVQLAVDEINHSGGVFGKEIRLIFEDDEANPEKTMNVYNLITTRDSLNLIIGSLTSGATRAITDKAQAQQVLLMVPAATNVKVTDAGDYIFRACYTDPFQGSVGALFALRELGSKKAAVLYDNGKDYSVSLKDKFVNILQAEGCDIVALESYITNDKDFNAQITKIKSANPDVVYIPDYYLTVALIAKQLRAQGINTPIVGADGWDGLTDNAGDEVLNGFYSNHYAPDSDNPKVVQFVKNYETRYKKVPTSFAALGYDACYLVKDAIADTGESALIYNNGKVTLDSNAIKNTLAKTNGDYLTGHFTFDAHRDPIKSAVIVELVKESGKLKTRYKTTISP
ncbi:MAG: ABC transporter substrate-binding protein [Spirochaetaceae bacterium]|nr:ABC transporter substrate-binding protein [Spirochaetaceae bacterium]